MTALTVVAYNVMFGDAILICIPERTGRKTVVRHVLIDVGNVISEGQSRPDVFPPIFDDINRRLNGRPIDLYVMTHEHMDHVQGFLRAQTMGVQLPAIDYAWFTGSSRADYYEEFTKAQKQHRLRGAAYKRVLGIASQRGLLGLSAVQAFLKNNDPTQTKDCVKFLQSRVLKTASYVDREFTPLAGVNHPFQEATFSIWAPERDTSSYYGRMRPVMKEKRGRKLKAPAGVKQDAFDALLEFSRTGLGDEMLSIDRSANNTSIVFSIDWRGWRLLFTGDAESRSWRTMNRKNQLRPVHFIKVGHHASHNGTPSEDMLDKILPKGRKGNLRPRTALVSTCKDTYNGVPDHDTQTRLRRRVDALVKTSDAAPGSAIEIQFDDRWAKP